MRLRRLPVVRKRVVVRPGSTVVVVVRRTVVRRGSKARSCTTAVVVVVPRQRSIVVRTGSAAADTGCRLAASKGQPVGKVPTVDKARSLGKGPMVDKGTGTGTDIRDRPRRLWARSPARPNSCLVCPFACPSASLQWYKVLKNNRK